MPAASCAFFKGAFFPTASFQVSRKHRLSAPPRDCDGALSSLRYPVSINAAASGSGSRHASGAVAGITLEEQRLTGNSGYHRRLERLGDKERRLRPLAGEKTLWIGGDEHHRHLEYLQQLVDGIQSGAAIRKLDIRQDQTRRFG